MAVPEQAPSSPWTRKTWDEFVGERMLWWANQVLRPFGWALVWNRGPDGSISEVYPATLDTGPDPDLPDMGIGLGVSADDPRVLSLVKKGGGLSG